MAYGYRRSYGYRRPMYRRAYGYGRRALYRGFANSYRRPAYRSRAGLSSYSFGSSARAMQRSAALRNLFS